MWSDIQELRLRMRSSSNWDFAIEIHTRSGGKVISRCNLYYGFDFARLLFYSSLSSLMFYSFVVDGGKVSWEDGEQKWNSVGVHWTSYLVGDNSSSKQLEHYPSLLLVALTTLYCLGSCRKGWAMLIVYLLIGMRTEPLLHVCVSTPLVILSKCFSEGTWSKWNL
jgi:hypothetical protein